MLNDFASEVGETPYLLEFSCMDEFEREYQAFVDAGGLDQTDGILNEQYERTRVNTLCVHKITRKDCVLCYKAPKPYMPNDGYIGS